MPSCGLILRRCAPWGFQVDLFDYIREAAGLPPDAGKTAVIEAFCDKVGVDRSTVYQWIGKSGVPKSAHLVALVAAVNAIRSGVGAELVTLAEMRAIAGVAPN